MIAITTRSSMSVNPVRVGGLRMDSTSLLKMECHQSLVWVIQATDTFQL
ncbi:MAG: hypothetical protein BWY76_02928 [bacterium ADurb.Bin429]|nr:MAG: hypothetical protein BWY76_02928 [bacterium ADurb.Bin429]